MILYLNNDTTGITIDNYNHQYNYVPEFKESYNIGINTTIVDINTFNDTYKDIPITSLKLKRNGEIIKNLSDLNLKLDYLSENLSEYGDSISIGLTLDT